MDKPVNIVNTVNTDLVRVPVMVPVAQETADWIKRVDPRILDDLLVVLSKLAPPSTNTTNISEIGSANLGKQGEEFIYAELEKRFHVKNMAKIARCGDFHINLGGMTFILEVKNYSKPVPSQEVLKFQRDLSANGAAGGIMVSLTTKITGHTQEFIITNETSNSTNIPTIYLVTSNAELIIKSVHIVHQLAQREREMSKEIANQNIIKERVKTLCELLECSSRNRSLFYDDINTVSRTLLKHYENTLGVELSVRKTLETMNNAIEQPEIIGGHDESVDNILIKYTPAENNTVRRVITEINKKGGEWKMLKKSVQHNCGFGLNFMKQYTEFSFDPKKLSDLTILTMIKNYSANVSASELIVVINETSIQAILDIITPIVIS